MDIDLLAMEKRARTTRDLADVEAYCNALMRLGAVYLQERLGSGRDAWQNLMYRHALKNIGGGSAGLDLRLPHRWSVVGSGNINFGACRLQLVQECRDDPDTHRDDNGLHPFFDRDARPLTFKETIRARMDQWRESKGTDWSLWNTWLDSCTAIVWEAGGRRFKIVEMHGDLLTAPPSNEAYLSASFVSTPGRPLTVDESYNRDLTFDEVLVHKGWLAALGGDNKDNRDLLKEYATIVFAMLNRPVMRFWSVRSDLPDHLRALCAGSLYDCDCGGWNLFNDARLARMRPP
ncbi:hypothetical protein HY489_01875 [Candidatus Woesearchaeota archaeon]|nr:hypothetical protein [Candidatus Woesearchaeota archaeon]